MGFLYTKFTLQTSSKSLLPKGWGEQNPLVDVTANSKEENSYDFCPKYVQEFGLLTGGKGRPNCSRVGERTWTV